MRREKPKKTDWSDILQPKTSSEEKVDSFLSSMKEEDPRIQELECLYQRKLILQAEEYQRVCTAYDDLKYKHASEVIVLEKQKEEIQNRLETLLNAQKDDKKKEGENYSCYIEYVKSYYEQTIRQMEEEHIFHMAKVQAKLEESTTNKTNKATSEKMLNQIVKLKREVDVVRNELDSQKTEFLEQQKDAERIMKIRIDQDTKKYRENAERFEAKLQSVALKSVEFQREIETLKQERNILQYELQECKEREGPLDEDLNMLQEQTDLLELDRNSNRTEILNLNQKLKQSKNKCKALLQEQQRLKSDLFQKNKFIEGFVQKISDIIHYSNGSNEDIKEGILSLYEDYVFRTNKSENPKETVKTANVTTSKEFCRQRNSLERIVDTMSKKMSRTEALLKTQKQDGISENAQLLQENIELRKSLVSHQSKVSVIENELRRLQRELAKQKKIQTIDKSFSKNQTNDSKLEHNKTGLLPKFK